MEAKHAHGARPQVPDVTEPRHQREDEPTLDEAIENVDAAIGVTWARTFDRHETPDGPMWVDTATGQTFDTPPPLHPDDGRPH